MFNITEVVSGATLGGAFVAVMVITLTTGLLSNRGVTNHPPLEVLRAEG
ncbi:MAG: hypothetical protein J6386_07020 [Candidatus Synoicihabitans palmerolidicus]|nr:hypothetical protein [Candidatus Synoicihabitans palmerolidicus]